MIVEVIWNGGGLTAKPNPHPTRANEPLPYNVHLLHILCRPLEIKKKKEAHVHGVRKKLGCNTSSWKTQEPTSDFYSLTLNHSAHEWIMISCFQVLIYERKDATGKRLAWMSAPPSFFLLNLSSVCTRTGTPLPATALAWLLCIWQKLDTLYMRIFRHSHVHSFEHMLFVQSVVPEMFLKCSYANYVLSA